MEYTPENLKKIKKLAEGMEETSTDIQQMIRHNRLERDVLGADYNDEYFDSFLHNRWALLKIQLEQMSAFITD